MASSSGSRNCLCSLLHQNTNFILGSSNLRVVGLNYCTTSSFHNQYQSRHCHSRSTNDLLLIYIPNCICQFEKVLCLISDNCIFSHIIALFSYNIQYFQYFQYFHKSWHCLGPVPAPLPHSLSRRL